MSKLLLPIACVLGLAHALSISVSNSLGNATSPYQYGLMFEDINHSGDGGIYAELIQNRAFQGEGFQPTLAPWEVIGAGGAVLDSSPPTLSWALPNSLKVTGAMNGSQISLTNGGYWGIDVKAGQVYNGSFYSKGSYTGGFLAAFVDLNNNVLASARIASKSVANSWTQHSFELVPENDAPTINNTFILNFTLSANQVLNFNLLSVFPPTHNGRLNGMRQELMQVLGDLKPSYFRFPGGNNLEGNAAPGYWNWSATIGPLLERPGRHGTWTYQNTDGLGLIEYLLWAQDLGMEPLLAVWDGLYLDGEIISQPDLQWYVNDTLNELDFLMGDGSTEWSAKRVSLGYQEPFEIKMVEIGNEDYLNGGNDSYNQYRFGAFYDAIKSKYPSMTVMSTSVNLTSKPPGSWRDYHQYTRPDLFSTEFNYFDNFYPYDNPVVIGEYACVQNNTGIVYQDTTWTLPRLDHPIWIGSVSEAIFLLGAERNADHVMGASYAPLLQNYNSYQWGPDLITFSADPAQTVVSTSYHVVKLFSNTRFTHTVSSTANEAFGPAYWVVGINNQTGSYVLKAAVYNATDAVPFDVEFAGLGAAGWSNVTTVRAQLTVLTAEDPFAGNIINGTEVVTTTTSTLGADAQGRIKFNLPPLSVAVLEVQGS